MKKHSDLIGYLAILAQKCSRECRRKTKPKITMSGVAHIICTEIRNLTADELLSLKAMTCFAAINHNMAEETVAAMTAAQFEADKLSDIAHTHYDAAMTYLVNFDGRLH